MLTRRRLVSALAPATLAGCDLLRSLGATTPTARLTGIRFSDFSLASLTLLFDVDVRNPYQVALPLVNIDYAIASGGQRFLTGEAPLQGAIPAGGSQVVTLPASIVFVEMLRILQGVAPGAVVPYHTSLGLSVNAPAVGTLRLPIEKDGQLPVPAVPDVDIASLKWSNVSLGGATGEMLVRIGNTNQFPIDLVTLDYGLQLAGAQVARSSIGTPVNVQPGAAGDIAISLAVSTLNAGVAVFRALQGDSAPYAFSGTLAFNTPFGPLQAPWAKAGTLSFSR